jgi:hypothetical protein
MIPRRLIRTVPEEVDEEAEGFWSRFGELHPGWDLVTFRDPIDPADFPLTAPHWARCRTGAQRAGLIRLEALFHLGGVYVDSDVEPYRPFDPLLGVDAFAAWEDDKVVPDAVLGARPGHPWLREAIDLAVERLELGAWASGPGVTADLLPGRSDVLLLPPGAFYPYPYTQPERRLEDHGRRQPWAFAAHHWAGSWKEAEAARAPIDRDRRPRPGVRQSARQLGRALRGAGQERWGRRNRAG